MLRMTIGTILQGYELLHGGRGLMSRTPYCNSVELRVPGQASHERTKTLMGIDVVASPSPKGLRRTRLTLEVEILGGRPYESPHGT